MNILLMSMPDITPGYHANLVTPPNFALQSIAGNLDQRHNVKIANLVLKRKNVKNAIIESLNRTKPEIVGLSAMTYQYNTSVKIARFIKNLNPSIRIALGGYHATLLYKEIAESENSEYFDFIFRGESDLSFNETINKLEEDQDLETVSGLSFKKDGKFIHNKKREPEDLNQIKLPDRNANLWSGYNLVGIPIGLVEYSRGCLMSCNFCNVRSMYGKTYRTYETNRVMKDIENAKMSGIKILFFADDNITLKVKNFERLCDEIIKNGHNDLAYFTQASSLGISSSERLVEKMAEAGFKFVFLGIESASKENLSYLNKGDILENSKRAVKLLKKNDILVSGGLIIGEPDDDFQSIKDTYEFASKLKIDFAGIQFLVPYPKTEVREKLLEADLVTNIDNFQLYNGDISNVRTKFLSSQQLSFIKFTLTQQYFKTRKFNAVKAILRNKRICLKCLKVKILKILFIYMCSFLFEKVRRLYLNEERIFNQHLQRELTSNEFDI